MLAISGEPDLGRAIEGIEPLAMSYAVASHFVVYRPVAGGIDVLRILHRRMDVAARLRS